MKTAVSVIVPCYNVAPYVDECMSGLAEQTLGPMEIICVDDGSTDGTLELLYRWREKDNRLRVISQSNAGVSAARNAGLDAAEGKYVGFVDPAGPVGPGVLPPSAGLSPPGQFLFFPACPPDVIPQRTPGGLLYPEKALGEVRGKTLLPSVFWCGMRP